MSFRRVRRPKNQETIYKELTNKEEFGFFSSYKDLFMFAGLVGFLNDKKLTFTSSAEEIAWSVFNLETDEATINAVALSYLKDKLLLLNEEEAFDKKLKLYEEFAAGGIEIIYEKFLENRKFFLNTVFEMIMDMKNYKGSKDQNIAAIADMISFE